jgi:hypothetical protein
VRLEAARLQAWSFHMDRRIFLAIAAAVGAAAALGAQAGPKITSDTLPGASFGAYKTFAWADRPAPVGMDPVAYSRIMQDVESAMAAKGYVKGDPADLTLLLTLGAKDKTQINSWGYFGRQLDVYQYTEGRLSLDVFDSQKKQAVWHGQADGEVHPDKPNAGKIDSAVTKLMSSFPARGP